MATATKKHQPEQRVLQATFSPVTLEQRDDGTPVITGLAAVYYDGTERTEYELWEGGPIERIRRGAFKATLEAGDDIRGLFNHDANEVLGRRSSGTLRVKSSREGLAYEIDPPDTQTGRDVAALVKRGDVSGSSFSFFVTEDDYKVENGREVREIRGAKVLDVGPVTFPAYEATSVQARSADPAREHVRRQQERQQLLAEMDRTLTERECDQRLAELEADDADGE